MGTLALEILEDEPSLEVIVAPVGGGCLIAGVATADKHFNPGVRVYGVQPKGADAFVRSLEQGRAVEIDRVETIADGLAVKKPSENTFRIIQQAVDIIVLVTDEEITAQHSRNQIRSTKSE